MAGEIVETSQLFARTVAGIDPLWIVQLAPHLCKTTHQNPHWSVAAGSVLVNDFKIPTIGYGPGCEAQAHERGEFVELEKMYTAIYGTAAIAHSLIGIPVCGWTADEI